MSYKTAAAWSLLAMSLALGTGQFGGLVTEVDAEGGGYAVHSVSTDDVSPVNRAAKSSRGALIPNNSETITLAFRPPTLANTTAVMRLPVGAAHKSSNIWEPAAKARAGHRKAMIACEPVVSAIVDVAKLLQPGRCLA